MGRRQPGGIDRVPRVLAAGLALAALLGAGCGKPAEQAAGGAKDRVIPVAVAQVQERDVPLYVDGIGTVAAYRTVTVRTQVDGRLDQVFFKEGQAVKKGDLLAQIDPRQFQAQLHQAEGAMARDAAQLDGARQDLKRYEMLAEKKLASAQQIDDQRTIVGQLEGVARVDKAAIETARLSLEYARIVSTIDGVTGIRAVDQGNVVNPGDAGGIVVVAQLDPIAVIFTLPQDVLPQVAEELARGTHEVRVFSRDGATEIGRGELEVIDNAINASTATLRLKAVLPNPGHTLWPNQFVKARLMLAVRSGAVVIPAPALQRGTKGTFVYVVGADETVQARPVEVERLQGDDALIASGLKPGETVVTEGQNQLRPGGKVALRGKDATGARPAGEKSPAKDRGPQAPGKAAK